MNSIKHIEADLEGILKILSVWDYRLEHPEIPESFYSEDYQSLLEKSLVFRERYQVPLNSGLPTNFDTLTASDIALSLVAGAVGAVVPKLTADCFDGLHEHLSHANGILGKMFNHDGEWIDTHIINDGRKVVKGTFHRFRPDGKHDPLNIAGLFTSWEQFGVFKGTLKYIIHIALDSCSQTGIPIPGTANFLYWVREQFGMKLFSLENQSRWAGLRMGDVLQAGATQGLVSAYSHLTSIPDDSLRIPQLRIVAHGVSIVGSTWIASKANNPKMLSKISEIVPLVVVISMAPRLALFSVRRPVRSFHSWQLLARWRQAEHSSSAIL